MNAIVFEHVPIAELPAAWRAKLTLAGDAQVKVRIEQEHDAGDPPSPVNPLVGMWRDREDMRDVSSYVRGLRQDRFSNSSTAP